LSPAPHSQHTKLSVQKLQKKPHPPTQEVVQEPTFLIFSFLVFAKSFKFVLMAVLKIFMAREKKNDWFAS